eukprot:5791239-Ditylum_brightwellii.AAC.1
MSASSQHGGHCLCIGSEFISQSEKVGHGGFAMYVCQFWFFKNGVLVVHSVVKYLVEVGTFNTDECAVVVDTGKCVTLE